MCGQYETTVQLIKCNMKIIIIILLFNALTEKQAKYRFDWYYWEHSDSLRQHEQ